ncbi:hypothetical protein ACJ41O_013834 [Fusarium nematophilum]
MAKELGFNMVAAVQAGDELGFMLYPYDEEMGATGIFDHLPEATDEEFNQYVPLYIEKGGKEGDYQRGQVRAHRH